MTTVIVLTFGPFPHKNREGMIMHSHFKISSLAVAGLLALTLAGCSNPEAPTSESGTATDGKDAIGVEVNQAAHDALPQKYKDSGKMVVTMSESSPPLHFISDDGHTTVGVDPELAKSLGEAMGVEVTIESGSFDAIIPGISAGKFDLVVSQMSPSKERMKVLDFVDYYQSGSGIGVAPGNPKKLAVDELCGVKVGVLKGSFQDLKRVPEASKKCVADSKPAIDVMTYPDMQAPILALSSGRIDAVYVDGPTLGYAIKQGGKVELLGEKDVTPVSIAFAKDAGLEKAVQLGLKSLTESGRYQQVLDDWGVGSGAVTDFAFNKAQ